MKKGLKLFIGIIIISAYMLSGCSKPADEGDSKETTKIVTSFYPIYLHTINIAKDIVGIEVINMTQTQTGCLHDYQLSPVDIKTLGEADIFVINGGGMESFMDKVLAQQADMQIINASEHIEFLEAEHEGHEEDDGHEHEFNSHVWVSIQGAIDQVKQIAGQLGVLDPTNKESYAKNASEYIEKLEELKREMHGSLDDIPNKDIVTFHEAFSYFAYEFDLNIVGTIVTEDGTEPSAKELSKVIEDIKKYNVKAVFTEPQYTSKAASLIAEEAGVGLYSLDPVVTSGVTLKEEDEYIKIMKENLKTLEEALR